MPIGNSDGLNILLAISSETIKKIAPMIAAIGTNCLALYTPIILHRCGIINPTYPIIPAIRILSTTKRDVVNKTISLNFFTFSPSELDFSSPNPIRLIPLAKYLLKIKTINMISAVIKKY